MRITNDCVQQDTISIEVNGSCATITEIVNQTPQMDCDELKVCIGPYFISLNDLIIKVYNFIEQSEKTNVKYFMKLMEQYNLLYQYFNKCCSDLIGRLTRIEKKIDGIVIIREIVIEKPTPLPNPRPRPEPPLPPIPPKPPVIITEEKYVIDQSIKGGYMDTYYELDSFGNKLINQYVFWLKDGIKRKLAVKEIPYIKGTPQANSWLEVVKSIFQKNGISLTDSDLSFKQPIVPGSFTIPNFSGRWIISGNKVVNLDGTDLNRFLPFEIKKKSGDTRLDRIISYRIDNTQKPVNMVGYEPIIMNYAISVFSGNTIRSRNFEQGVNFMFKFS
jgi:hypothetical protein